MHEIKKRWERYRVYGVRRGLAPESAEDFAQEAYMRFLEAGVEIKLEYVFIDYLRVASGRSNTNTARSQAEHIILYDVHEAQQPWDLVPSLAMVLDEGDNRGIPQIKTMRRLAYFFGVPLDEIRELTSDL